MQCNSCIIATEEEDDDQVSSDTDLTSTNDIFSTQLMVRRDNYLYLLPYSYVMKEKFYLLCAVKWDLVSIVTMNLVSFDSVVR